MDPLVQFCHDPNCTARPKLGRGNIRVQSRKEKPYRWTTCGQTFAATRDTPFYRLKKSVDLMTLGITLLCHGCPVQALVVAFGLDERTVADWRDRAGRHGQRLHEHVVLQGQVELGPVQADELDAKVVGRRLWMAMAMAVPSRLGLGGVVSPRRDLILITAVVRMVRHRRQDQGVLGVCRRPGELGDSLHPGLPRPGADWQGRSAVVGPPSPACCWVRSSSTTRAVAS